METTLAKDYGSKKGDYFDCPRSEMLSFVPASCRRILEVGCGRGFFGRSLRQRGAAEVWGVEPDESCIAQAKTNLTQILPGCFEAGMKLPADYFDCIIFNDVLEHLLDPLVALEFARTLLAEGGSIVASIPNIGHFPVVWKLVIRGEWKYEERGILDKTHLRFYTRNGIENLFRDAGFEVRTLQGINPWHNMTPEDSNLWWRYRCFGWLPIRGIHDMRYLQFAVVARRQSGTNAG